MSLWAEEDIKYLETEYPEGKKEDIIKKLGRTWEAIQRKAERVGIRAKIVRFTSEPVTMVKIPLEDVVKAKEYRGEPIRKGTWLCNKCWKYDDKGILAIGDLNFGYIAQEGDITPIVSERMGYLVKNIKHLFNDHVRVKTLYICLYGDMAEGQENYAHQVTESTGITDQIQNAVNVLTDRLDELITFLYGLGIKVKILAVAGNHGKTSQFRSAQRDNIDMLIYYLVRKYLVVKYKDLEFEMDTKRIVEKVNELNLVLEHGDDIKGYNGVGWYGVQKRVERLQGMMGGIINIYVFGHNHGFGSWFINDALILNGGTLMPQSDLGERMAMLPQPRFWLVSITEDSKFGFLYTVDLRERDSFDLRRLKK